MVKWAAALTLGLIVGGCQSSDFSSAPGDGGQNDAGGSGANDAGNDGRSERTRAFRLATTGAQLLVQGPRVGLQLTDANTLEDSDVLAVHLEFYGLPWSSFEAGSAPPPEWVALVSSLASSAKNAKKPVFLSITPLNGSRTKLAPTTRIEDGAVKSDDTTSESCYDFATAPDAVAKRAAYLRYVEYMIEQFDPTYLNVAIELNLFAEKCASAWPALVSVVNAAYDAAKAKRPGAVVFPSFQLDHLYGYSTDSCASPALRPGCYDTNYAKIATLKRDRFAMSSYPFLSGITSMAELPDDWFSRAASRNHERPLIAETGWLSTPLVAKERTGACTTVFSFDEADSAAYLRRVLADADSAKLELVTWWADRDLVVTPFMSDCPCSFDVVWCTVLDIFRGAPSTGAFDSQFFGELGLKAFGTMGLRRYDGTPKPAHLQAWNEARGRRYVVEP